MHAKPIILAQFFLGRRSRSFVIPKSGKGFYGLVAQDRILEFVSNGSWSPGVKVKGQGQLSGDTSVPKGHTIKQNGRFTNPS